MVLKSEALIITRLDGPIGVDTMDQVIERALTISKLHKHVTCHTFRHTCATHLVKNQANIRHVQELLGHKSLTTTQKYVQLTITDLKEAHRKFHHREQESME